LMDMKEKARELNIEDSVLFLGKQNWVSEFYQISDLVLLLSEKESFGLTLLEAMKSGVLPIGSTAGGIKEVIKHKETGVIVDVGDSNTASTYALELLTNDKLYNEMQQRDRKSTRLNSSHVSISYAVFCLT